MSAPRCSRRHRPVFCQRRGDVWMDGQRNIRHVCPVCGALYFTRKQPWRRY